jgi:3',5'-cyclic AMP phosphodiesterase CpdA
MKIVHLSDIHVWRYTWNLRHLLGRRALGMMELLMGRARRFQLDRLAAVVDRAAGLEPDHIVITGDLTTTALPSEFREAARLLAPLLTDPARVSIVPGNHDRTTGRSFRSRRFEGTFGAFMPALTFPWLRRLDSDTAILGLDPTRTRFSPRGRLPADQLAAAQAMTSNPDTRSKILIVACHYPVAAPVRYQRELFHKRLDNDQAVRTWLAGIGPHLHCCGHVHAAWAFQPPSLPNQICLNAGAPLMRDPTGLRLPGFLEIQLEGDAVTVIHQAWTGAEWKAVPMLQNVCLATIDETVSATKHEAG